jgi:hypothetical protein
MNEIHQEEPSTA